jgi:hypothetical protein
MIPCILFVYGGLGFTFATLLAVCKTKIDGCWIVENGADFLFVSLWWPIAFVVLGFLSVVQLTIKLVFGLKNGAIGRYILRVLDSWVAWLRS